MGDAARLLRLLAPGRPACSFCEQAGSHICVSTAVLVYAVHPLVVVLLFRWVPYVVYSCIVAAPPRTPRRRRPCTLGRPQYRNRQRKLSRWGALP